MPTTALRGQQGLWPVPHPSALPFWPPQPWPFPPANLIQTAMLRHHVWAQRSLGPERAVSSEKEQCLRTIGSEVGEIWGWDNVRVTKIQQTTCPVCVGNSLSVVWMLASLSPLHSVLPVFKMVGRCLEWPGATYRKTSLTAQLISRTLKCSQTLLYPLTSWSSALQTYLPLFCK